MTEKELITKIRQLRQVSPRKDWVVLTKNRIFTEQEEQISFSETIKGFKLIFRLKPAFVFLVLILILIGTLGFAQTSVPGDLLYSLRKATENVQKAFVAEEDFNIKNTNRRLDDLAKIAQTNSAKNLAPAINEYKASILEVAKSLTKAEENKKNIKEIVKEVQKIEERTAKIKSLGIEIGGNEELDLALVKLISSEIKDLENRILTEEQFKLLEEVKKDVEEGNYAKALEKVLILTQ